MPRKLSPKQKKLSKVIDQNIENLKSGKSTQDPKEMLLSAGYSENVNPATVFSADWTRDKVIQLEQLSQAARIRLSDRIQNDEVETNSLIKILEVAEKASALAQDKPTEIIKMKGLADLRDMARSLGVLDAEFTSDAE